MKKVESPRLIPTDNKATIRFPPMIPLKLLAFLVLIPAPCQAAVSILIQPGPSPGTAVFTLTQTSPSPVVDVSGITGYSQGISLPTSMFNFPALDPGHSSDVFGDLVSSVGTITEAFSGEMFELTKLRISSDPFVDSLLGFDRLFTVPIGAGSLRFDVETAGEVVLNIAFEALHPGVHLTDDLLFGTVTVTVIPEPSAGALLLLAAGFSWRRKRPRPLTPRPNSARRSDR